MESTQEQKPGLMTREQWQNLCLPAQIYAVLTFISILILAYRGQFGSVITTAIVGIIMTLFMSWLCMQGFRWVSWTILLLPFIMTIIFVATEGAGTLKK